MLAAPPVDRGALVPLLPEPRVGVIERIDPIALGLSGAGVYAVKTSRGAFVLRVQRRDLDPASFAQQLIVLQRAADAGIAPALVHVDAASRAVVSAQVAGLPVAAVFMDPAQRGPVLASVVERLRTLHALDVSGVAPRDPIAHARSAWATARLRPAWPPWAADSVGPALDAVAGALADDRRRAVSHNDLNPGNILWDGSRAWIVDWEVTGLGHPHYDLATLALFLRLDDSAALDLVARHDGAPPDARSAARLGALRRLAGVLCGLTFLGMVDDPGVSPPPALADTPRLVECYRALQRGELPLHSAQGKAAMGWALLAEGLLAGET